MAIKNNEGLKTDNVPALLPAGCSPYEFASPSLTCGEVRVQRERLLSRALRSGKSKRDAEWALDLLADPEKRFDYTYQMYGAPRGISLSQFERTMANELSLSVSDRNIRLSDTLASDREASQRRREVPNDQVTVQPGLQRQTEIQPRAVQTMVLERPPRINFDIPVAPVTAPVVDNNAALRRIIAGYSSKRKPALFIDLNSLGQKPVEVEKPQPVTTEAEEIISPVEVVRSIFGQVIGGVSTLLQGRNRGNAEARASVLLESVASTTEPVVYTPNQHPPIAAVTPRTNTIAPEVAPHEALRVGQNKDSAVILAEPVRNKGIAETFEATKTIIDPLAKGQERPAVVPMPTREGSPVVRVVIPPTINVRVDGKARPVVANQERPAGKTHVVQGQRERRPAVAATRRVTAQTIEAVRMNSILPILASEAATNVRNGATPQAARGVESPTLTVSIKSEPIQLVQSNVEWRDMEVGGYWTDFLGLIKRNRREVETEVVDEAPGWLGGPGMASLDFLTIIPLCSRALDALHLGFLKPLMLVYYVQGKKITYKGRR